MDARGRSRSAGAWLAASILLLAARASAMPGGVRALPTGGSSVHFVVEVPEPRIVPAGTSSDVARSSAEASGSSGGSARVVIEGYQQPMWEGAAPLPARIVFVAVPPTGRVLVRSSAAGIESFDGVRLSPDAAARPSRDLGASESAAARLLDVSWMRNQRVARVAIFPARYDASLARVSVARAIDVEVEFEPREAGGPPAEPSDRFEAIYRQVLVNYEQGIPWRRPARDRRAGSSGLDAAAPSLSGVPDTSSVLEGHDWLRIAVPRSGFYQVTLGDLRKFTPFSDRDSVPFDRVRLFGWPGYPVLPENSYCDQCDFREVAIGLVDDGDGLLTKDKSSEGFYFYALGASDWADYYDASQPDTVFVNHPYETNSFFYLTISDDDNPIPGAPHRIATASAPPVPTDPTPATFVQRVHRELDLEFDANQPPRAGSSYFWEKWFWQSIAGGSTFRDTSDSPGADATQSARLRIRLWAIAHSADCVLGSNQVSVDVGGSTVGSFAWRTPGPFTIDAPVTNLPGREPLGVTTTSSCISIPAGGGSPLPDQIEVAWWDLFYPRRFEPVGDVLTFETARGAASNTYDIGPFVRATPPRVFDVSDAFEPIELKDLEYQPGTGGSRLRFHSDQTARKTFRVIQDTSMIKVAATSMSVAPRETSVPLRGSILGADYVVIYFDPFAAAAESLAAWRAAHDGYDTMTVAVSSLYDQFSGGRTDPAAIRNFLRAAFLRWKKAPTFVTLLGDASFDFKNILRRAPAGQPGCLLPSYENGFDNSSIIFSYFATDDWLLNVDDPVVVVPDFIGGRIPVTDPAMALDAVRSKVLFYDRAAPLGEYRNRVMLIADDARQGAFPDLLGWVHLQQTAVLDSGTIVPHVDRDYIYLHTYPTRAGNTKPEAKTDIKQQIQGDGVAIVNYIGHGSPSLMSDEQVFLDNDADNLSNPERLPVFLAASCDIGRFDDPRIHSIGELLVTRRGGGAIGVVSATGEAFSGENADLDRVMFERMFSRDAAEPPRISQGDTLPPLHTFARDSLGQYHVSVGEALLMGKFGGTNSEKYQWLGDAATRPNLPRLWVEITLLDSAGINPITELRRGATVTMRGRVVSTPVVIPTSAVSMSGAASVLIEDSAPLDQAPICASGTLCNDPPFFYFKAGPIFRGDVELHGGAFQTRFIVPLEARTGARGRARVYVSGATSTETQTDGVGSATLQVSPAVCDTCAVADTQGPRITLSFPGGSTVVRPDAVLTAFFFDPSGILITGHTPQNEIIVTVDDNSTQREDITAGFRYATNSYQSGVATYQLKGLAPGPHRIRISAADNLAVGLNAAAHRSSATIDFTVAAQPPLKVDRAYLFPDPARSGGANGGGQFVVDAPGDPINLLLRIYTVSGRLIRVLKSFGGQGQVQIPWDGLDDDGHELANGVYLFRVNANVRESDGSSSAREVAHSDGRFVILGR